MVVFTCNNCGDSVTKPKVEKHIQYECKRKHFAVSFCCVDCLKDFNYESVKDHCQCVTEEQRYSAKGFVPKPSAEKGKRKQAGWVDIVQSVIDRKDIPDDERQFLNIISKYDNVPRKKNKFQNFCFSSAPTYRKKGYLIDKVFDMIEAEYKAQQIQNSKEKTSSNNIENQNNSDDLNKNNTTLEETSIINNKINNSVNETEKNEIADNEVEEVSTKKKKKSKKFLDVINNEEENKSVENIEPQFAKKNKKKQKTNENSIAYEENLELKDKTTTEVQPSESAKNSKKKHKLENNESNNVKENSISKDENMSQDCSITTAEVQLSESAKKSKKKRKLESNESNNTHENGISKAENINQENGVISTEVQPSESGKKSKRKHKLESNESNTVCENGISKTENISQENGVSTGQNGTLQEKSQIQLSKKEKKEMKKKMKYQHELTTVSNGVLDVVNQPISKKKRKIIDNEENEEPQKKILKTETPQVQEVQPGSTFEWNEAIKQVLQKKKNKPMSINKVMKRVLNEYHSLNEATKKSESKLEKIFLKKLRKLKNVVNDNGKIHIIEC